MNIGRIVERYIAAWNQGDVDDLLALMHKGAAYYDAFWMETCVGRDLPQYFQDIFDDEPFWYQQLGDLITTESGVVFRYRTYDRADTDLGEPIYDGAEVLNLRDGLILTVSDFYCDPRRSSLQEVATLAATRHGVASHTRSGLGAARFLHLKARLAAVVDADQARSRSSLTLSQLADQIGCPVNQLLKVIDAEYGTKLSELSGHCGRILATDVIPAKTGRTS